MILVEADDTAFQHLIDGEALAGWRLPDGGIEGPEVLTMLRDLANSIRPKFSPASWMMVEHGEIVGLCSLVREPVGDEVHIGYGVAECRRKNGFASAGVRHLVEWAREDGRVTSISAETSLDNVPSQRVLQRNGFDLVGERVDDEDGPLLCWRLSCR